MIGRTGRSACPGTRPEPSPVTTSADLTGGHPARNQVRFSGATTDVPMLTESTSAQREAFDLIGVPIPLALR